MSFLSLPRRTPRRRRRGGRSATRAQQPAGQVRTALHRLLAREHRPGQILQGLEDLETEVSFMALLVEVGDEATPDQIRRLAALADEGLGLLALLGKALKKTGPEGSGPR